MVRQWDIGTHIQVDIEEPVSTSTARKIVFRKPSTAVVEKEATTGDTDTTIRYTTVAGDLDESGTWTVEGWVQFADGSWHTGSASLVVERVIQRTEA